MIQRKKKSALQPRGCLNERPHNVIAFYVVGEKAKEQVSRPLGAAQGHCPDVLFEGQVSIASKPTSAVDLDGPSCIVM